MPSGRGLEKIADLAMDLSHTTATATATLSAASPPCRALRISRRSRASATPATTPTANPAAPMPTAPIRRVRSARSAAGRAASAAPTTAPLARRPRSALAAPASSRGLERPPNRTSVSTIRARPTVATKGRARRVRSRRSARRSRPTAGASTDADCPFAGDTCTLGKFRDCFTDNGLFGASVHASGVADPPVNHEADPTLASLYCIGPTKSAAVNWSRDSRASHVSSSLVTQPTTATTPRVRPWSISSLPPAARASSIAVGPARPTTPRSSTAASSRCRSRGAASARNRTAGFLATPGRSLTQERPELLMR